MNRRKLKLYVKIFFSSIFIFLILGYSFYQSKNLLTGPLITIAEPENGSTVQDQFVKISGSTKNIKKISLNDRFIFIDEAGFFMEKLLLSEGYNILKISAWDKFDKKTEKILEIVYKPADNEIPQEPGLKLQAE